MSGRHLRMHFADALIADLDRTVVERLVDAKIGQAKDRQNGHTECPIAESAQARGDCLRAASSASTSSVCSPSSGAAQRGSHGVPWKSAGVATIGMLESPSGSARRWAIRA